MEELGDKMNEKEVFCDVCGIQIINDAYGIHINIPTKEKEDADVKANPRVKLGDTFFNNPEYERVKGIFGKDIFYVCTTCFLKSLGVKPK